MRQLPYLADDQANVLDGYGLRRIQEMKCSGKTKYAVVMPMMSGLVGRCGRSTVGRIQAKLSERKIVKGRSIGQLGANDRQKKRLHHKRVNSRRANQPSPE
jgi:hypothetical protein